MREMALFLFQMNFHLSDVGTSFGRALTGARRLQFLRGRSHRWRAKVTRVIVRTVRLAPFKQERR